MDGHGESRSIQLTGGIRLDFIVDPLTVKTLGPWGGETGKRVRRWHEKPKKLDQPIGARVRGPALWLVGEGLSGLALGLVDHL